MHDYASYNAAKAYTRRNKDTMDATECDKKYLFGGDASWPTNPAAHDPQCIAFRAVDDRVRGGSSRSHLTVSASSNTASFHGVLDTKTLGGAGFASQVTIEGQEWDLSEYAGLELRVSDEQGHVGRMGSGERYVLLVKDSLAERRPDGREESGVSWEYVFHADRGKAIKAQWEEFKPTYRGREIDVPEGGLKTQQIKRVGLMMRSFFDAQSGPFDLPIHSIAAFKSPQSATSSHNSHFLSRTTSSTSTSNSIKGVASHTPPTVLAYKSQPEPEYKSEYPDEKAHLKMKDDEMKKAVQKLAEKEEKERRTQERNARTGIGALTGEMRDRGEGGMPGWRGWVNWIGRGCL